VHETPYPTDIRVGGMIANAAASCSGSTTEIGKMVIAINTAHTKRFMSSIYVLGATLE
jgi:hypothetical protein